MTFTILSDTDSDESNDEICYELHSIALSQQKVFLPIDSVGTRFYRIESVFYVKKRKKLHHPLTGENFITIWRNRLSRRDAPLK
jgi:hypothetical protein